MAGNLSDYAEIAVLDWLLGGATPTRPPARYVALFTAAPTDAGGGTEVSGGGYARQAMTCGAAASGATSNSADVSFTASGAAFGTVSHIGIFDASTAGNLLWWGALTTSKAVGDGDTLTFAAGDIDFSLD